MAGYWLKLYTEILDDPKYARLSDDARLGMYELMIIAKRFDKNGLLPNTSDLCFFTRRTEEWWKQVIDELIAIKFIVVKKNGYTIRKFEERQAPVPAATRQQLSRKKINLSRNVTKPVTKRQGETETETETETDTEQTPAAVVVSKPKDKKPLKATAASMLVARMVSQDTLKELLQAYQPAMLIDYCHAYDQAVKDGKADNPGWLVKALKQQWDIKKLLAKRDVDLLQINPARYVAGKYEEFVEH